MAGSLFLSTAAIAATDYRYVFVRRQASICCLQKEEIMEKKWENMTLDGRVSYLLAGVLFLLVHIHRSFGRT